MRSSLKEYVQFLVGVEGDIDIAEMKRLDKYGFDVRYAPAPRALARA